MYLASVIAGETYCILNCDYCMYTKKIRKDFSEVELSAVLSNISKLKQFIDSSAKNLQIMSLTGGEPAMFPEIIKIFYESFNDKLIRICSNWVIIDKIWFDSYSPDRMYFAISLDGIDLEDNFFRFKSKAILDKILSNIDALLENGFSVEILTVLSPRNIWKYIKLLQFFEKKYPKHIEGWQLWFIPFELANYMDLDKFRIDKESIDSFIDQIKSTRDTSIVLSKYKEYFNRVISFYSWNKIDSCFMYKWGLYFKYLGDSLWNRGAFNVYWCWSRWHLMMGTMNFNNKYDKEFILERRQTKSVDKYFKKSACIRCFDNWHFYWLLLQWKLWNIPWILKKTLDSYHH